ncbi:MAG: MaoC family dehydratase N-terminal domain-containing protein [Pseudomonadota bacterium]
MTGPTLDLDHLRSWIGRTETTEDVIAPRAARLMQATLDRTPTLSDGDPLPPFWHHLYFNEAVRASDLGVDGHEKLGRFLPPVPLPRRMWAGGAVDFRRGLFLGDRVEKCSTIQDVALKTGRSGPLCFVTVGHDYRVDGALCLSERQDIVYRAMPQPGAPGPAPRPAPGGAIRGRMIVPDPVLLFRYSALIFYGHRIHYDPDFTRGEEGYPGLIVHGPLIATLLADIGAENRRETLHRFDFRAVSPLFAPTPFRIAAAPAGASVSAWAETPEGNLAMVATLDFV